MTWENVFPNTPVLAAEPQGCDFVRRAKLGRPVIWKKSAPRTPVSRGQCVFVNMDKMG